MSTNPETIRRDLDASTVRIFAELDAIKVELRHIRHLLAAITREESEPDGR